MKHPRLHQPIMIGEPDNKHRAFENTSKLYITFVENGKYGIAANLVESQANGAINVSGFARLEELAIYGKAPNGTWLLGFHTEVLHESDLKVGPHADPDKLTFRIRLTPHPDTNDYVVDRAALWAALEAFLKA